MNRSFDRPSRGLLAGRAGFNQLDVTARAGITQSMLSRAEHGRASLDADALGRLADIYGASGEERRSLLEMAASVTPGRLDSRLVMQRGDLAWLHDRIHAVETQATVVRSYQQGAVLGVLQTPAYIEAVFTARGTRRPDEVAPAVGAVDS